MFEDPPDLAAHRVALALAQILDLLGDVLTVETIVGYRHRAQHRGLVLGPGKEIIVVARSIGHTATLQDPATAYAGRGREGRGALGATRRRCGAHDTM